MTTYIVVYVSSFLLVVLITPAIIRLACRIGAVDWPGPRAVHNKPIPRIGGMAIFIAAMAMVVAALFLNNTIGEAFRNLQYQLISLFGLATVIFVLGLLDDLRGLPARFKFLIESAAVLGLWLAGVRISSLDITSEITLTLGVWGFPLTLLWCVGITNAVNLSDGLDGLAAGVSAITCGVITVIAIHDGNTVLAVLMLAMAGSLSGFLLFNFSPARIFMGDCGSLFVGFMIAASSLVCLAKSSAVVALALPALALGVPILDTLFSMLRRFLEGRSLFAPDREHFHHRLIDLGLGQRHAVMAIYLMTFTAASSGLLMMVSHDIRSLLVFGSALLLLVVVFQIVGAVQFAEILTRLRQKHLAAQCQRQDTRTFEELRLHFRCARAGTDERRAIRHAAGRMGLTSVVFNTTDQDGIVKEEIWGPPQGTTIPSRILTVRMPLQNEDPSVCRECEIAIDTNGSLETASRRVTLFSRLLDEHQIGNEHDRHRQS